MKNPPRVITESLLILIVLLTFSSIVFTQEKSLEKSDAPVLDYETEIQKTTGKEFWKKDKTVAPRGTFGAVIAELPIGVEPLPTINHWWVHLPALPTDESIAIIFGEITGAEAHLSNDKTDVYSEFLVHIEKVFKDTGDSINFDKTLSVNRLGGNVRFASGRINKYTIHRQGMPQKGEHYVLFLSRAESGDFMILTGYKIADKHVSPLDGEDSEDPRTDLSFSKYRNADESIFLQDLRIALSSTKVSR